MSGITSGILKILTRREKISTAILVLLDLAITLLDVAFLGLLLIIVNFYTRNSHAPTIKHLWFDQNSLLPVIIFFLAFCLKNWAGYCILKLQNRFYYAVATRLSSQNIKRYLDQKYLAFTHIDSSVHFREISHQPIEFSTYILTNVQQIITQCIIVAVTTGAILFYRPLLFVWLFILLLPTVAALMFFIKMKLKGIRTDAKSTHIKVVQYLQEALGGFIESNIYYKKAFFSVRYISYQQKLNGNISTQQTLQGLSSRSIEVFAVLGFVILLVVNKLSGNANAVDLLSLGIFVTAAYKIIPAIVKLLNSISQIKTYAFVLPALMPGMPFNKAGSKNNNAGISSVTFDRVGFSFEDRPIVSTLSFEILPSDFIAISGRSGLGKTTVINLLLGFLQPDCGDIKINGKVADERERQSYWPKISYVKQQSFFINDTVLKNIVLSDDGYSESQLNEILKTCGLDVLLKQYPEGIQHVITEDGKNLSGGQRQRIMLARALYHDFDLLLLDEPFSELDESAEKEMLMRLDGLAKKGKMILFITHNKAALTYCNKIINLDEA